MDAAFNDLEPWQREVAEQLGLDQSKAKLGLWHNYRLLQVYDLLSLYFCRDGVANGEIQEVVLEGVPVSSEADRVVDMRITPTGPNSLRLHPYPLDVPSISVSMMTRVIKPVVDAPELVAREQYYKAPRRPYTWHVSS